MMGRSPALFVRILPSRKEAGKNLPVANATGLMRIRSIGWSYCSDLLNEDGMGGPNNSRHYVGNGFHEDEITLF